MVQETDLAVVMPVLMPSPEAIDMTSQALDSFGDIEKVIVDNHSPVGSGWIRQKATTYIGFSDNRGYTVGMNKGICVAQGEYLGLANNDLRVSPQCMEVCREILQDPEIATVHPKMVDYDAPFNLGGLVAKEGKERWCHASFYVTTQTFLKKMRELEWGKEPFPGLIDETYGIGGGADDWDWLFRIRKLGFKTCYTNRAAFQHMNSFTYKQLGPEREQVVKQNNEYFEKKWGKPKDQMFAELYPEQMKINWKDGFV